MGSPRAARLVVAGVLMLAAACGKGGAGWACRADADCDDGLRCGLLETGDGSRRTMCVNPDGVLDPTQTPRSYRTYALPIGVAVGVVGVLLLWLRASVRARRARRAARTAARG